MPLHVEPVMHVVITAPQEWNTAVLATVAKYRGRLVSTDYREASVKISARIPQAEVGAFSTTLVRQTDGRASTSMVLYEYWPISEPPPGEPEAGVREPRPRVPVLRSGAVAIPEPD
jgi:elongation factor G